VGTHHYWGRPENIGRDTKGEKPKGGSLGLKEKKCGPSERNSILVVRIRRIMKGERHEISVRQQNPLGVPLNRGRPMG